MQRKLLAALMCVCLSFPVNADPFGASDARMIMQLSEMVKSLKKQLDTLNDTKDLMNDIRGLQEYRNITTSDILNGELNNVVKKFDRTFSRQVAQKDDVIRTINKIDRLLNQTDDSEKRKRLNAEKSYLQRQLTLTELSESIQQNAVASTEGISEADAARSISQSTNTMALLAIEEQKQQAAEMAAREASFTDETAILKSSSSALRALSDSRKEN